MNSKKIYLLVFLIHIFLFNTIAYSKNKLKEQIVDIQNDIQVITNILQTHKKAIDQLKDKIAELKKAQKKDIDTIKKDITENKKLLDKLLKQQQKLDKNIHFFMKRVFYKNKEIPVIIPHFGLTTRPEFFTNLTDLNSSSNDKISRVAQRIRIGFEFHPFKVLDAVFTGQYVGMWGIDGPNVVKNNGFGLYNGYIRLHDFGVQGMTIKVGRMQLNFGSGRVIGTDVYDLKGRAFDAAVFRYNPNKYADLSIFASVLRYLGEPTGRDSDLFGVYYTGRFWHDQLITDVYSILLMDGNPTLKRKLGTFGVRGVIWPVKGLRIEGEASIQYGKNQTFKWTHTQFATAYFASIGYTFSNIYKPYLKINFSSASGDANPTDSTDVRYIPLFPSKYAYWGWLNLFNWSGVVDSSFKTGFNYKQLVGASTAFHAFFLSSEGGFLPFGDKLVFFPPYQGKTIGYEWELMVNYQPWNFLNLQTAYGLFIPAKVTKKALKGSDIAHGFFAKMQIIF